MSKPVFKFADELRQSAQAMVAPGKGILAMDESNGTCCQRFEKLGIECTEETRRQYRELLITTPGLEDFIAGPILYDETIRQSTSDGRSLVEAMREKGMLPGIKVDTGAKPLAGSPGEKVTEGLDGLRERLADYYAMGARFAKWRAVVTIGEGMPTRQCIEANAHALARYAALCQENGLVPIVEPEVLINGGHSIEQCEAVTRETWRELFNQMFRHNVMLDGAILKASMVISGLDAPDRAGVQEVAERTVQSLLAVVPPALAGVVFLSGGQGNEESTQHLNAMNAKYAGQTPWPLTFSYARALQGPPMEIWKGDANNVKAAQDALHERARLNSLASLGEYRDDMERRAA